ncbi:MAG: GtrA family protein [Prevotellaceae bacterium]|jgi:putative flippase GtrA|nr:GtrA family protein [Prevotellaceae bacterium]
MLNRIKRAFTKFSSKGGVFVFLRAQLSSQMATVLDNCVAFSLKKTLDIFKVKVIYFFSQGIESYVFATIVGQIIGGFFVCFMNYRWTFKVRELKFRYIFLRFILVWLGSIVLNTFFTFKLTELLRSTPFLIKILGNNSDDIFILVKLTVALVVGFVWNYTMYRVFVYKNINYHELLKKIFRNKKSKNVCSGF